MNSDFVINSQLENDSHFITEFELSQVRLIPDGENPWFLLIPKISHMIDWSDLSHAQQHLLTDEINTICEKLKTTKKPDKLNVASLGNMVPQLHIHVIARYKDDRAWPNAIWGTQSKKQFDESEVEFWKNQF